MYKVCLVTLCIGALANARPQAPAAQPIAILSQTNEIFPDTGSYKWSYETENKISAQETGEVRNFGQGEPNEILTVNGGYEYDAPDGTRIKVQYKADENGFVPVGDHLPTPPPVPPAIAKAVAYLLSLPSTTEAPAGRR